MVNTTSKRKRKSHNNRTRLSRRVKRGGAPPGQEDPGWVGQLSRRLGLGALTKSFGLAKQDTIAETEETKITPVVYNKPTTDKEYLKLSNIIKRDYALTDKSIANGDIAQDDWNTLSQEHKEAIHNSPNLLSILRQMKEYQISAYTKLLKKSKPEYPYARNPTDKDKDKLKLKKEKEEKEAKEAKERYSLERPDIEEEKPSLFSTRSRNWRHRGHLGADGNADK